MLKIKCFLCKYFIMSVTDTKGGNKATRNVIYLTYMGLMRFLIVYRTENVRKYQECVSKILLQMKLRNIIGKNFYTTQ